MRKIQWSGSGHQQGLHQGEAMILLHLLTLKFGPLDKAMQALVQAAPPETLLYWSAWVLTATTAAHEHRGGLSAVSFFKTPRASPSKSAVPELV
ncbi:hypothetical protein [Thiocystis violacea]|uniref:hypothetical protein n=1 Tax=Thiocystis violacea TaxID=13725 RepID=UPI001908541B|nr:hypothetical protein [Thiocystis violacea]